jgi:hypothetical protein
MEVCAPGPPTVAECEAVHLDLGLVPIVPVTELLRIRRLASEVIPDGVPASNHSLTRNRDSDDQLVVRLSRETAPSQGHRPRPWENDLVEADQSRQ